MREVHVRGAMSGQHIRSHVVGTPRHAMGKGTRAHAICTWVSMRRTVSPHNERGRRRKGGRLENIV